jgi:hypothetical protein
MIYSNDKDGRDQSSERVSENANRAIGDLMSLRVTAQSEGPGPDPLIDYGCSEMVPLFVSFVRGG